MAYPDPVEEGRRPWLRRIGAIAVIGAVASPALRDRDSFPLSTYPMYATVRGERFEVATVVGRDAEGSTHRLSLGEIAQVDDPLLAQARVARSVAAGRAAELCREVAARAARRSDGPPVRSLAVVTETHDTGRWLADDPSVVAVATHAECPVGDA